MNTFGRQQQQCRGRQRADSSRGLLRAEQSRCAARRTRCSHCASGPEPGASIAGAISSSGSQHEGAQVQPRMRQGQARVVAALVAVQQQVEVERARRVAVAIARGRAVLDRMQRAQQGVGRQRGVELDHGVDVVRPRCVDRRDAIQARACASAACPAARAARRRRPAPAPARRPGWHRRRRRRAPMRPGSWRRRRPARRRPRRAAPPRTAAPTPPSCAGRARRGRLGADGALRVGVARAVCSSASRSSSSPSEKSSHQSASSAVDSRRHRRAGAGSRSRHGSAAARPARRRVAGAALEARLHHPDLAHVGGQLAAARDVADARVEHRVDRLLQRRERRLAALAQLLASASSTSCHSRQASRKLGATARPSATRRSVSASASCDEALSRRRGCCASSSIASRIGNTPRCRPVLAQLLDAGQRMAGLQQLDHLVEQARRRHVGRAARAIGRIGARRSSARCSKPSLAAKRTTRTMRTGSSR